MSGSSFSVVTLATSSSSETEAGRSMVAPCIPASSQAFAFALTYTELAGSSPTRTTANPGRTPLEISLAVSRATSSRIARATAFPSMISAGKGHRACFADQHNLDLAWILKLSLDAPRNLFAQCCHARIIHIVRRHDDAHLTTRLNREDFLHPAIARSDLLQSLETLHVRLERLAPRARP